MLTIDEIKNISFRKATLNGGYRAEDVDSFIDEVIVSFEQLKKEKTNLVHKIDVLATRVEQYRADEETVRNALLASQKVADACIREAKEKAAALYFMDGKKEANTKVVVIDETGLTVEESGVEKHLEADTIISAFGMRPNTKLADQLKEKYPMKTRVIGDCYKLGKIGEAVREGFFAASSLD